MSEGNRAEYLDDLLATNTQLMERNIAHARETLIGRAEEESGVPAILRGLSSEEWGLVRSIIQETLKRDERLTDSVKIPLLYLEAESWDTVFWILEHAWREEWEMEEVIAASYRQEVEETILKNIPCMLPSKRLGELTAARERGCGGELRNGGALFREIQRIREEAEQRAMAIRKWCTMA